MLDEVLVSSSASLKARLQILLVAAKNSDVLGGNQITAGILITRAVEDIDILNTRFFSVLFPPARNKD